MLNILKNNFKDKLLFLLILSAFINLLVLSPSWYMLEVYDRVINSQNTHTLAMLTWLIIFLYVVLECAEWIRLKVLSEISEKINLTLKEKIFTRIFQAKFNQSPLGRPQGLNDVKEIEDFIISPGFTAILDAPFSLITLMILLNIHPQLAFLALAGGVILCVVTILNQIYVAPLLSKASEEWMKSQSYLSAHLKNAEVIEAMGMHQDIHETWLKKHSNFLTLQAEASYTASKNVTISKFVQMFQGSLILGFACWLILQHELEGSMMIISSILAGRVLSPFAIILSQWRSYSNATESKSRLDELLLKFPETPKPMTLPTPEGHIVFESVAAQSPDNQTQIIKGVNFNLPAGKSLAVIGPTGSGKTTLAKLAAGIWPTQIGKVRLDGAEIYTWDKDHLGQYIGYLPQDIELFEGSIAENIVRFGDVDINKLKEVAELTGLNYFLDQFEYGFETTIGDSGAFLSGGQRQLIALARAIYNDPKVVILDEPNSNLDEASNQNLIRVINALKSKGSTIIIVTHRPQILEHIEYLMILMEGQIFKFGPTPEVLKELQPKKTQTN